MSDEPLMPKMRALASELDDQSVGVNDGSEFAGGLSDGLSQAADMLRLALRLGSDPHGWVCPHGMRMYVDTHWCDQMNDKKREWETS